MARIQLGDSIVSVLTKMSDGNPGALRALMEIKKAEPETDPCSVWAAIGMGGIFGLDTAEIYGPRIWMLFSDVCNCDPVAMLVVLRAHQLGFLRISDLQSGINNRGAGIDVVDLHRQVKEQLGTFGDLRVAEQPAVS